MPDQRVVVAMSGGVDSSVAAALLVEQGYEVVGVTLQIWPRFLSSGATDGCCSLDAVDDARRVCQMLGIPHYVLNLEELFEKEVIGNFRGEYLRGRTPNPCIVCNQRIKFGALLERSMALAADKLATGHYVRLKTINGRHVLMKGKDPLKDQSYALYRLTQRQLAQLFFPLGEFTKDDTRKKAEALGLRIAQKPESQDICFIPDNDYRRFLREYAPGSLSTGPIVDTEGNLLGRHQGIAFYTIGQRKGLGLSTPVPMYVVDIWPESNTLVVGQEKAAFGRALLAEDVNFIAIPHLGGPLKVEAKIRYNIKPAPAMIRPTAEGIITEFEEAQRAITPGQSAVWYQGDVVVGGGIITSKLD